MNEHDLAARWDNISVGNRDATPSSVHAALHREVRIRVAEQRLWGQLNLCGE